MRRRKDGFEGGGEGDSSEASSLHGSKHQDILIDAYWTQRFTGGQAGRVCGMSIMAMSKQSKKAEVAAVMASRGNGAERRVAIDKEEDSEDGIDEEGFDEEELINGSKDAESEDSADKDEGEDDWELDEDELVEEREPKSRARTAKLPFKIASPDSKEARKGPRWQANQMAMIRPELALRTGRERHRNGFLEHHRNMGS